MAPLPRHSFEDGSLTDSQADRVAEMIIHDLGLEKAALHQDDDTADTSESSAQLESDSDNDSVVSLPAALQQEEQEQQPQQRQSRVSFGVIQIREYNRIVGDHPDVKVGPPMSIGWDFVEHSAISLNEYEENRPPRKKLLRRLSSITRKNLLVNVFGIDEAQVRAAEKENQKIQARAKRNSKTNFITKPVRKLKKVMSGEAFMKGLAAAAGAMVAPGSAGMSPVSAY